jgi:hypothetical protein
VGADVLQRHRRIVLLSVLDVGEDLLGELATGLFLPCDGGYWER